jgi:hypothetical protein
MVFLYTPLGCAHPYLYGQTQANWGAARPLPLTIAERRNMMPVVPVIESGLPTMSSIESG